MAVSLNMVLTFPPTYPDVAPEITFETIEDDEEEEEEGNGELTEEEEETVLGQLNTIVRLVAYGPRSCAGPYATAYPVYFTRN
jgi:hypothetical protein